MAGQEDKDNKTEEATEKKTRDAVEKGNVPFSREAAICVSLFGILISLTYFLGEQTLRLGIGLRKYIELAPQWSLNTGADATALLGGAVLEAAGIILPVVAIFAFAGIVASLVQNPPQLATERVRPQMNRISITSGWSRLFGMQGLVEFLKAASKLSIVGVVGLIFLRNSQSDFFNALFIEPASILDVAQGLAIKAVSYIAGATTLLVAADIAWSRQHWKKDLRMSRQEVKDEHKQLDGDPMIKARQRAISRARSRQRMISAVPRATFVIANPTHYAVALRYVREEGGAPVVVAKGQDLLALRIRKIAEQNDIPVIENKALARSLYARADVDQAIPPEFYKAVASVVYFLSSRKPSVAQGASRN